jgi:uridine kinase
MAELALKDLLKKLKEPAELIARDEGQYAEKVASVAERVCSSESIRVVLLAGPSGSGKTTTANLICDKIKSLDKKCTVVSLDNFYRDADDPRYPLLEDGTRDFESPYALDLDVLLESLGNIIAGKEFSVPRYDFKVGGRVETTAYESYADGCVIIEGIHALNPILSDPFPRQSVLKLFVSVSTNINNVFHRRILSGRKLRFVRRMVRDNLYRGADAMRTLSMWENVLRGEDKYLYPFKELADVKFDTFHTFEPAVMKPFAQKLLTKEVISHSAYAKTVARALSRLPALDASLVPETSLIKEFIPGGIYEDLY